MKKPKQKIYYHFTRDTLRNGQPIPPVGKWLKHEGKLVPCASGLHASEHPFDALRYAHGNLLHRVVLRGEIIKHGNPVDKVCAKERKIVQTINAEQLCRDFVRKIALDMSGKWDAPKIVLDFLKTGDRPFQVARDVACDAAGNAALEKYRGWFAEMVDAEFAKQTKRK